MVAVIDYGLGNVGSILRAFARIGVSARLTRDSEEISQADRLVLAGVGSFDKGMQGIEESGLRGILEEAVIRDQKPILGICLGMQLLFDESEEGSTMGLSWIRGRCVRFDIDRYPRLKVPHMGWNDVRPVRENPLIPVGSNLYRFYFVHSYHAVVSDISDMTVEAIYGYPFPAAIQKGNIMGVQFHPEKSHLFGLGLLRRFAEVE